MPIVLKSKEGTSKLGGIAVGMDLSKVPKSTDYSKHLGTKVASKEVSGTVSIKKKSHDEPAVTAVPVHTAVVDGGCKVGCGGSRTINLGNYESIKISVWLEMPCSKDTVSDTYDYVSDWVGEQLNSAVKMTKET